MFKPDIQSYAEDESLEKGPADRYLEELTRLPNVAVSSIDVLKTQYVNLQARMQEIALELGRLPATAVFCANGIYRSKVIAEKLINDGLTELSMFNWDLHVGQVIGAGLEDSRADYFLDLDEEGGMVWKGDQPYEPFDVIVLVLGPTRGWKDRKDLAKVTKFLGEKVPETSQQKQIYIIWLDAKEEDLKEWFPELARKE